jgi:hypothetical protein
MATDGLHSNLPPFGKDPVFPPPNVAGEWVAPGTLRQLGQSLLVDDDPSETSSANIVRAIPDPWAQARTFAEAVLDEHHSMHGAAIAQWRGLLALFALAEIRRSEYSLDIKRLEFSDHPFDRLLRHLAPQIAIGPNANLWLRPHIVYLDPQRGSVVPIALLNPASLVSPGRTTWRQPFKLIPWMKAGLSDPLKLSEEEALSNAQLTALDAFLGNLRDSIPHGVDPRAGSLRQALQDYLDEVQAVRGPSEMTASVRRPVDPELPELYQQVVLPAEIEEPEDPAAASNCRLSLVNPSELAPLQGVILVDESLATTLKGRRRDVIVWGNHTLSELLDSPPKLQTVRKEAAERGYWVVTSDDLFTDRLVRLRKDPRIPGHGADHRDLLEPVRPLVLLLDQSATRGIEIDASQHRATCTLHMRLENGKGTGAPHSISRTYRKEDGKASGLIDGVDWDFGQTSIWPDFKSRNWSYYFARLAYPTTREQIRPQFALSRDIIAKAVSEGRTAQHALQALQEINSGSAPAEKADFFRRFQNVSGKTYEELQISNLPFEAVFYVDYHPDRGDGPAGCVRLKLAEPKERSTRVSVAIDFGSTNSVACFSGTDGQPVTLKGRVVHPIMFNDPARNDEWQHIIRWHYVDFLPLADRTTPTPTVVINRNDADRDSDLWLCRNLIYFQPAGQHAKEGAEDEVDKLASYLKRSQFDLKWSEDPRHIAASMDFLSQFMTMIAAEAAANEFDPRLIEWHFSVPDAMRGPRLAKFRANIEAAQSKISPDVEPRELYSEGLAAARYILSGRKGSKFTQGSINAILDIGGSTTDITLWAHDELIWRGSFRLAGRAFFTDTIVQNPQILREIELGDWADLIDPDKPKRVAQEILADVGELLFSRPALAEAFDKHWHGRLNVKPGEELRATALVFLAGISHYLGMVARQLIIDGALVEADLARPAFALCGRGAGIFTRMHGSNVADRESQVTLALQNFSRAACVGSTPRPQLFVSKQPKLEVAAGMMVDFDTIDARAGSASAKSSYVPLGLEITFANGTTFKPDDAIGDPISAGGLRGLDLTMLQEFLTGLEELTGIAINLRPGVGQGAFNEISNVVRQEVDRQKDETGAIVLREPPFITALGALIGIMASPETERKKRIAVEIET